MTGDLINEYFEWLYNLVCSDDRYKSYRKLCMFLFDTDFYSVLPMDENRYSDGISIRYRFGDECDYPGSMVASQIDQRPCSVFEMMVALALRMEEDIAYEERYGDRTGYWFRSMLQSLGLIDEFDGRFDKDRAQHIIDKFLERMYQPNGKGGLFTVNNVPEKDLRDVEIWCQANWYLIELWEGDKR